MTRRQTVRIANKDLSNRIRQKESAWFKDSIGEAAARISLVIVIGWIGSMKFTDYDAQATAAFVGDSDLFDWVFDYLSIRTFGLIVGVVEISIAICLALGAKFRVIGIVGAIAAILRFATTFSLLLTSPNIFQDSAGGFPALSVAPGQFLIKDLALLGISISLLCRSWNRGQ